jgi:tripeptide aminopeptidase
MANRDRLIKTLMNLIRIDSPTGEENAMDEEVTRRLRRLGFSVYHDTFKNVIADLPGEGEPLLLSAHLDTVEPGRGITPILDGNILRSDGTTILGGDCKSGVSIILEALTSIIESDVPHLPIQVAFSRAEEGGLTGARNMDMHRLTARRGIVFDAEGNVNRITVAAPSQNVVKANIYGKASHAGIEPENGISAILIAASILTQLPLGRIDDETTANIGRIEGGLKRNIIPDNVFLDGEIRSLNQSKFEQYTQQFRDVFDSAQNDNPDSSIVLDIENTYTCYNVSSTHDTAQMIARAVSAAGLTPKFERTGGGSDANVFFKNGISALPVGIGVKGFHTKEESANIDEVLSGVRVCEFLITGT